MNHCLRCAAEPWVKESGTTLPVACRCSVSSPIAVAVVSAASISPASMKPGRFFSSRGPLNTARPPQGRPVLIQAGGSPQGRQLAAKHMDCVVAALGTVEEMKAVRADLRERVAAEGRAARFDATGTRHHHFICDRCGKVEDMEWYDVPRPASGSLGKRILRECELIVRGLCTKCAPRHASR